MKTILMTTLVLAMAVTAAAEDVTFGYTGSTADNQHGLRMDWAGSPGLAAQFRWGDEIFSAMIGPSVALTPSVALYGLVGFNDIDYGPATAAAQVGASARLWRLRAHVGYDLSSGRSGGVAFGLGWATTWKR